MEQDLPIVTKLYSVLLWVLAQLSKLPRDHRFLLGDRIAAGFDDLMESLVRARHGRSGQAALERASATLTTSSACR